MNTLAFFEWEGAQPVERKHHGVPLKGPVFDPNGIPIEFCYGVAGHDVHKNPVLSDDDPPIAATEGSEYEN